MNKEHIDRALARLPVLETELSDPATAANQKKFRKLVQEHSFLKKLAKIADRCVSLLQQIEESCEMVGNSETDEELRELAQMELDQAQADLPAAEEALMAAMVPPSPDNNRNAIVEIRAGTGGDEAGLFAGDLFRMYERYADQNKWKIKVIDASQSEIGGYKEIVFTVVGDGAYGKLQYESGGHRVQRVPTTESQGRIHTSAATVAVFPEAEPDDDISLEPDEIRIDVFRSSGPGGQSVNTTDSAVRITHLPTGIKVQCQDEKSQHRNREKAMSVLKSRVLDAKRREEDAKKSDARRTLIGSGDRRQRIRTYNFPQNRLTDHRMSLTLYSLDRAMEGEIEVLITSMEAHDAKLRLEDELNTLANN